jgi:hypothetical protein
MGVEKFEDLIAWQKARELNATGLRSDRKTGIFQGFWIARPDTVSCPSSSGPSDSSVVGI